MNPAAPSPTQRFHEALTRAATAALGRGELGTGTVVVSDPGRAGSISVACYPRVDQTIIWAAPEMSERLAELNSCEAMTLREFAVTAARLGGTPAGTGAFRVLDTDPFDPAASGSLTVRDLDRERAPDRELIGAFIASCSPGDLDEAELDLDDLDPEILAVLDDHGAIVAYASGRPWSYDTDFDDVGIITRPDCRGRGLGASAVAAYARRAQREGRFPLYNCNDNNVGSARLAESVGFTLAQHVASARFDGREVTAQ